MLIQSKLNPIRNSQLLNSFKQFFKSLFIILLSNPILKEDVLFVIFLIMIIEKYWKFEIIFYLRPSMN